MLQTIAKLIDDKVDTKDYVKNLKKSSKDAKKPNEALESSRDGSNLKKTTSKTSVTKANEKLDSNRKKIEKKVTRKGSDDASPKIKDSLTSKSKTDSKKKPSKLGKTEKTSSRTSVVSTDIKLNKTLKNNVSKSNTKEKISPRVEDTSTPKTTSITSPRDKAKEKEDSPKNQAEVEVEFTEPQEILEKPKQDETGVSPRDDSWKPQVLNDDLEEVVDKPPSYQESELSKDVVDSSVLPKSKPVDDNIGRAVEEMPPIRQPSARPKSARPRSGSSDQRAPSAQIKIEAKPESKPEVQKAPESKPVMAIRDFSMKNANKEHREQSSISRNKEDTNSELATLGETEETEIKRTTPCNKDKKVIIDYLI